MEAPNRAATEPSAEGAPRMAEAESTAARTLAARSPAPARARARDLPSYSDSRVPTDVAGSTAKGRGRGVGGG